MADKHRVFFVKCDRIGDFLEVLDPRESARVTYRGFPDEDYLVVLEKRTSTWNDPDRYHRELCRTGAMSSRKAPYQSGITPVQRPADEDDFVAALSIMPVVVWGTSRTGKLPRHQER